MGACVFCSIASGEIPAKIVFESERVLAFEDIAPQAPVHVLVVPKGHFRHLSDGLERALLAELFEAVPRVAEAAGVHESGYRVIVNSGRDANQTVEHLHVHVIGGAQMTHGLVELSG